MCIRILAFLLVFCFSGSGSHANESITVLADRTLDIAMSEIARSYARDSGTVVNISFLPPEVQQEKITEGVAADVVVTPLLSWIETLKMQGLVDVYSLTLVSKNYYATVVAGENMEPARKFLEYLKMATAQKILTDNGFKLPAASVRGVRNQAYR